ncbi:SUMO-specific isopeptidase USPL1 isoform X2 [Sphaerodactylus townsendi]|uniref:SUMO-specific isopeptidase USPL1 isoform X2 n=1 Tax=Sphaerodactylus townsendi TaxID=933632 RepID=UPI0020276938|nr:SUMO-specific isopeptidase USPL1 isoform X2 [Sphaerodactylus townsendi]
MDYQKTGNGLQDSNSAEIISDGCCPLCKKKGLVKALRIYRINFQESIFLCENLQCIYPLGFESLNNIIVPVDPKDYSSQGTGRKRKFFETSLITTSSEPSSKLDLALRYNEENLFRPHSGHPDFSPATQPNLNHATESTQQKMEAQEHSPHTLIEQKQGLSNSEPCSLVSKILPQGNRFLSESRWLQWRNVQALCWLDCILSILVHLETLKMILIGSISENSSVIHRLLATYNQATALVNNSLNNLPGTEPPVDVLSRAESQLNKIRNTVFAQLQPQLKCTLGQEESPVFAFPLLLGIDPQIEKLFLHSFSWKFECLQCGHQVNDRCQKTLTTFTNIVPEWHPLNAIHIAPCNNCKHRTQRRKMVLEQVPSILMMHFVDGLPHDDLMTYSFQFQEDSYQISAVVQYLQEPKHFVAWVFNSDGTWLECDDLQGSYCSRRERFGVPPSEVHIVIWERKPPQVTKELNLQLQRGGAGKVPLQKAEKVFGDEAAENTPLPCYGKDLSNAHSSDTQNVVANNKSNSLWGFENLADDDEITLTLVSVTHNSVDKPLGDSSVSESNLVAETLQQQDPGGVAMSPLLENTHALLHGGQPNDGSTTSITPEFSPSGNSYSPETLPVQTTLAQRKAVPLKDSCGLLPERLQSNISRRKSLRSVQETPKPVQQSRERASSSHTPVANCSSHLPCQTRAKPFVASWMQGLQRKNPFMPKSVSDNSKTVSSQKPLQKETIANPLIKGAANFGGFLAKHSERKHKERTLPSLPSAGSLVANHLGEKQVFRSEKTVNKIPVPFNLNKQVQPKQTLNGNKNFTSVENGKESHTHQLRIQLSQLKDKKKIEKQTKARMRNGKSSKKSMKEQLQFGSQEEDDCLRELQFHIGVEDGKSQRSGTSMSQCSSDDILSELLSPATTVASLELPVEEECKYLEMGGCRTDSPVSREKVEGAQYFDHSHYIPEMESLCGDYPDILANHPTNPTKQDIFEELRSSVLNSVMDSAEVFHNFDESLLTL